MAKSTKITPFVTDMDMYLFGTGTHYEIYKKLGSHPCKKNGKQGMYFAVWAPNAAAVHLISDYNGWNEDEYPMNRLEPAGIYEIFIPDMGDRGCRDDREIGTYHRRHAGYQHFGASQQVP